MKASVFLQSLNTLQESDLIDIKGVGEVLAHNYSEFLSSSRFSRLVEGFKTLEKSNKGLIIKKSASNTSNQKLSNEIICITGSFDTPRPKIKEMLEELGAKVTSSVTSSTTILLAGEKAGSKLDKAKKFGTKIINNYNDLL